MWVPQASAPGLTFRNQQGAVMKMFKYAVIYSIALAVASIGVTTVPQNSAFAGPRNTNAAKNKIKQKVTEKAQLKRAQIQARHGGPITKPAPGGHPCTVQSPGHHICY
jgi:hypothetical protein